MQRQINTFGGSEKQRDWMMNKLKAHIIGRFGDVKDNVSQR